MWIAIATISMSFAALTSAMVVRQSGAPDWQHFQLPSILYANTLVLLISSVTLEWARRRSAAGLSVTLGLGLLFVAGQITAWRELSAQGLFLATAASSSFFYVFTALHGLHVLGGLGGVGYVLQRRLVAGGIAPATFGAVALYWHFMAMLWLYLLLLLVARV
jgi:cytochrome c oxidase subunit 3